MNVLVVGGGGREHALAWKLRTSPSVDAVFCCPGNAGIAQEATCLPIKITDSEGIIKAVHDHCIDLVVIGPEQPLVEGLTDLCGEEGIPVFGPNKDAARLEGSKVFAKEFMAKYDIPTADFRVFNDTPESIAESMKYIRENPYARIIKADGLCGGKGAIVCSTTEEAEKAVERVAVKKEFGDAGKRFIIEDRLSGQELSVIVLSDGKTLVPLVHSQDHKQVFAGDKGPNTGGMGAYAPVPFVTQDKYDEIINIICQPLIDGLLKEGIEYKGVIYAGLMINGSDIRVLEFNCRFGDPETQPILHLLQSDFGDILNRSAHGELGDIQLQWESGCAVCVVMASGGYPGAYEKGKVISGLEEAEKLSNVKVFHAGTALKDDKIVTSGGRVLGVTAKGASLKEAVDNAYDAVKKINFENHYFRPDIGFRVL